ncbi:hypothetical protein GA730_09640, partial [Bifidobacterium adolescentis]
VPKPGHVLFIGTHNRICARRRALSSNRGFLFCRMKTAHRIRAMPSYVRAGIPKCARIRTLSEEE